MSNLLMDESPLLVCRTLADEIGVTNALVLQQIHYWIEINKKQGNNYYDGKYWTYKSLKKWQEEDFTFYCLETVKRTFQNLEKMGLLIVGNYNKASLDRTKWYTINYEKIKELENKVAEKKLENEKKALEKSMKSANASKQNEPTSESSKSVSDISIEVDYCDPTNEIEGCNDEYEEMKKNQDTVPNKSTSYQSCLEQLRISSGYNDLKSIGRVAEAEEYDEILKILADAMIVNPSDTITINRTQIPAIIVQNRFKQLTQFHLEYLVNKIKTNKSKIRNIRSFILTAAYNAPSELDAYYTSQLSYDMNNEW